MEGFHSVVRIIRRFIQGNAREKKSLLWDSEELAQLRPRLISIIAILLAINVVLMLSRVMASAH